MSDHMAPAAYAAAARRKDDAARAWREWCTANAAKLNQLPADLAQAYRTFAQAKSWHWAQSAASTGEVFDISPAERAVFKRQWISQTRRLRYGPVEGLTEAEWKAQMEAIEGEYWPKRQKEAA